MILGHYELGPRLGQGGMGVVYEALDQKLGRKVAIKLRNETARDSSHALERFWREARTASALNHPGICTIYELNESTHPPFIVMELLEGKNLEKLCCGKAMPYSRLIELGIQLADGLDTAHRKGILHRDIKPANIFQTERRSRWPRCKSSQPSSRSFPRGESFRLSILRKASGARTPRDLLRMNAVWFTRCFTRTVIAWSINR
jgi:serine/threonine protein kinase